jgi:hypothetical protein
VQRVELTVAALSGDVATFSAAMPGFADEARRLGATYDLLVVLTLAGRLGVGDGEHATSALAAQLGVVTVAPLPAG